jgi:two-component system NtrC family response regulator
VQKILIIDDDEMMCKAMSVLLKEIGAFKVKCAFTLEEGLERALTESFDLVLLDVMLPDGDGLTILKKVKESQSRPEVIIITASGDADAAELAIKSGAWDYIEKRASIKEMILPLTRALEYRKEKLTQKIPIALRRDGIIGDSPKMQACYDALAKVSSSDTTVFISGETGAGKELFAHAVHKNSQRSKHPFVIVDCASLPENLVESILFGHVKGAFTGADQAREGLIQQADGGTLFLDEVGELPLSVQKSFLRVLQEHRYRPVGAKREYESDFRLVVATNRDLEDLARKGTFREDLLFRLRSFIMEIPPLRERPEDIKEIVRYHINRICDRYGKESKGISNEFFDVLMSYAWPGNVRELVNAVEAAVTSTGDDPTLYQVHLPTHIRIEIARNSIESISSGYGNRGNAKGHIGNLPDWKEFRRTSEKEYIQELISLSENSVIKACRISGLSRSRIYDFLKKHHLSIPQ